MDKLIFVFIVWAISHNVIDLIIGIIRTDRIRKLENRLSDELRRYNVLDLLKSFDYRLSRIETELHDIVSVNEDWKRTTIDDLMSVLEDEMRKKEGE